MVVNGKHYFPEFADPFITGELKFFKGLIGGEIKGYSELLVEGREEAMERMRKQAEALGISPRQARDKIVMRLDLASRGAAGGQ